MTPRSSIDISCACTSRTTIDLRPFGLMRHMAEIAVVNVATAVDEDGRRGVGSGRCSGSRGDGGEHESDECYAHRLDSVVGDAERIHVLRCRRAYAGLNGRGFQRLPNRM